MGEKSLCGHYKSEDNMDNILFLVSDTRILRQRKLQYSSRDISGPCILICKKRNNFLVVSPNSLNGTSAAGVVLLNRFQQQQIQMIQESFSHELENRN